MKSTYERVEMIVIAVASEDIITTSGPETVDSVDPYSAITLPGDDLNP